jgi:ribonuclease HII
MLALEQEAWGAGARRVAGVDEAGRGPWAGPVFAAAVVFDREEVRNLFDGPLKGLTDSKRLSAARRRLFFDQITSNPRIDWAVTQVSAADVDRLNILQATLQAMARAIESLRTPPDLVLVDGPTAPKAACSVRRIIRGDSLSLSIAAASVLAKVSRDRWMCGLDARYPGYGFARHKGYGTAAHQAALLRLGPCPEHRKTFRPVAAHRTGPGGTAPRPEDPGPAPRKSG